MSELEARYGWCHNKLCRHKGEIMAEPKTPSHHWRMPGASKKKHVCHQCGFKTFSFELLPMWEMPLSEATG